MAAAIEQIEPDRGRCTNRDQSHPDQLRSTYVARCCEDRTGGEVPEKNPDSDDGVVEAVVGGHEAPSRQRDHGVHLEGKHRGRTDGKHGHREDQGADRGNQREPLRIGHNDQRHERGGQDGHADNQATARPPPRRKPPRDSQLAENRHQPGHHEQTGHK